MWDPAPFPASSPTVVCADHGDPYGPTSLPSHWGAESMGMGHNSSQVTDEGDMVPCKSF